MDQKDKKEIVKMMGEILENNVLPVMEEIIDDKLEVKLAPLKKDLNGVKKSLNDLDEKFTWIDLKLQESLDHFGKKFKNHEDLERTTFKFL